MTTFETVFGTAPDGVWRAPGRVNLIGEHTDYNDGLVLPIALPNQIVVSAAARADGVVAVASSGQDGVIEFSLDALEPGSVGDWAAYPAGAAWVLREAGYPIGGANLLVDSDLPSGAGLSSSAALLCATAVALLGLQEVEVDPAEVARLAQRAENSYVGAPVGLMDQMASMCCTAGHALYFDIRAMSTDQIPFDPEAEGLTLLVIDVKAPHRHVDGEYAARRKSCEQAAAVLGVPALRSIAPEDLDAALARLSDDVDRRRVRHVVTEIRRVEQAVELMRAGRLRDVGPLFTASHASLRDDFEITVPELDVAVDTALAAGALGARMTGGGFGGCIIALVETAAADRTFAAIEKAFAEHGFRTPTSLAATPSAGASRLA
ncbi:galactokinase [Kribbella flavida DSM 17836]|uniref:Galactokinase n=1 Tax=Kribbella flavida (strain DSM 17836 / JCM 10339 / NBRC 14399) TaxID=479435 RepID=D2Q490_KRIFD|nr:galactokinase [Kribbella flavida]ADB30404.1 galactokinase [Kribbella flavida DSM 17836]